MLFRLSEVHKSYGTQDVLRGTSLQVNPGEHVGLVGHNGAGKSTIFRLVRGDETADRGEVVRARGVKLGLLDQHVHFKPGSTVHESALAAFGRLQQIEHEMHELEHRMAEASEDPQVKALFVHVTREEKEHVAEGMRLLNALDADQAAEEDNSTICQCANVKMNCVLHSYPTHLE